jgi:hypothetical protein
MTEHTFSAVHIPRFVFALCALVLMGTGCAAKVTDNENDASNGPSGTLTYKGVVSGGVTFPSADCAFDGQQHMIGFTAPHQDIPHPEVETPGPIISIGFFEPGAAVNFTTSQQHPTHQTAFMRLKQKDGVGYAKKGDKWVVTITDLKMPNLDVMNQQWATLSGTLVCTHLING